MLTSNVISSTSVFPFINFSLEVILGCGRERSSTPITLIEDRRKREDSPLLGWWFSSRRIMVWGRLGIFEPSHHPPHSRLLSRVNHKAPWSSRCILWWTCLFIRCCSTLGRVEAFVSLFWLHVSSCHYLKLLSASWLPECRQACGHGHMLPSNTSLGLRLVPCSVFGSRWGGSIFIGGSLSTSSLTKSASSCTTTSYSSILWRTKCLWHIRVCVENLVFRCVAPLFEHGFLPPITLIKDQRKRDDSPLLGQRFSLCRTMVP